MFLSTGKMISRLEKDVRDASTDQEKAARVARLRAQRGRGYVDNLEVPPRRYVVSVGSLPACFKF